MRSASHAAVRSLPILQSDHNWMRSAMSRPSLVSRYHGNGASAPVAGKHTPRSGVGFHLSPSVQNVGRSNWQHEMKRSEHAPHVIAAALWASNPGKADGPPVCAAKFLVAQRYGLFTPFTPLCSQTLIVNVH
jgi:hypothetical protein